MNIISNRMLLLLTLVSILLWSCSSIEYYQKDPFYRNDGGWDGYKQFPLIKPYKAIYPDPAVTDLSKAEHPGWTIWLEGSPSEREFYYYLQIIDIQDIAVENGVIMVYSPYEKEVDESSGEKVLYWFVIIPDQNVEMGFDLEDDFLTYIQQFGIQNPAWRRPDTISLEFAETGCLEWIPGCE